MPSHPLLSIAVAGAGVGGLAAATLLRKDGHRVRVYERFENPAPVGSGLMLQRTGLAVLDAMGLGAAARARGEGVRRLFGRVQPSGRIVLDVRFAELASKPFALAIQRAALFQLLFDAAHDAGVIFAPGRIVADVDRSAGVLHFTDRATEGPYDLVIDALGARSPLSRSPRRDLPYGALWATLDWPKTGAFDEAALEQRYLGARQMAGVMACGVLEPGAPRKATYFWSLKGDAERDWRAMPLDAWKEKAFALWPETAPLLDQIRTHGQMTFARYRHRTLARPVRGRLVHLGDSWHSTSPQLGQGANMALLDAWALAVAVREGAGSTAARARRYVRNRRGHVRLYQLMSRLFTPFYQSDGRLAPWLRDRIAAPVSNTSPGPQLLAAMVSGGLGAPLKRWGLE